MNDNFLDIAKYYDRMNTIMTLGRHFSWRRKFNKEVVKNINIHNSCQFKSDDEVDCLIDIGCGTGTSTNSIYKYLWRTFMNVKVYGIDVSKNMIDNCKYSSVKGNLYRLNDKDISIFFKIISSRDKVSHPIAIMSWSLRNMIDPYLVFSQLRESGVNKIVIIDFSNDYLNEFIWSLFGKVASLMDKLLKTNQYSRLHSSVLGFSFFELFRTFQYGKAFYYDFEYTIKKINNFTNIVTVTFK